LLGIEVVGEFDGNNEGLEEGTSVGLILTTPAAEIVVIGGGNPISSINEFSDEEIKELVMISIILTFNSSPFRYKL
jgi:hypothetical protein